MEEYLLRLIRFFTIVLWIVIILAQVNSHSIVRRETSSCAERSSSGLICQSCDLMATCVKVNGVWLTVPVETCDKENGFYCNLNQNGCSNLTGPCHPLGFEGNFACTSEGIFPDPYDCQKYHMCYKAGSTLVSANIECGASRAFSAHTGQCSVGINHPICMTRQYVCNNAGDSGPWPENNNIFYICKATLEHDKRILYPTLYRCAPGEIFNGLDCIINEQGNNSHPSSPSDSLSTLDQNSNYRPTCSSGGLFPNPSDCHSYFHCHLNGSAVAFTCPTNTYFNKKYGSCVIGKC